jgi:hypothetical protein
MCQGLGTTNHEVCAGRREGEGRAFGTRSARCAVTVIYRNAGRGGLRLGRGGTREPGAGRARDVSE